MVFILFFSPLFASVTHSILYMVYKKFALPVPPVGSLPVNRGWLSSLSQMFQTEQRKDHSLNTLFVKLLIRHFTVENRGKLINLAGSQ